MSQEPQYQDGLSPPFPKQDHCQCHNHHSAPEPRTPWTATRLSPTTFVLREDDAFQEHPLIYVKLHPTLHLVVLTDTGCDRPAPGHETDDFVSLRAYLEHCPLAVNGGQPLNPRGERRYLVLFTHCHYDHCLGISSFLDPEQRGGRKVEIVASAAGKGFIENDLAVHGQYAYFRPPIPVPRYRVTKWAEAFERLRWRAGDDQDRGLSGTGDGVDLGVVVLQTQGHTPDELAWFDDEEKRLYVGDSLYDEGDEDEMPIIFPREGNLVEWVFSMQKLAVFVKGENARLAAEAEAEAEGDANASSLSEWCSSQEEQEDRDWILLPRPPRPMKAKRVLLSAAHQTQSTDAETFLRDLEIFAHKVFIGAIPVVDKSIGRDGEEYWLWRENERDGKEGNRTKMSIQAPVTLVEDARKFFGIRV